MWSIERKINWTEISIKTNENAKTFLRTAEILAEEGIYCKAYAQLVFALEEHAKSRICSMYNHFGSSRTETLEKNRLNNDFMKRIEIGTKIEESLLNKMFKSHLDKQAIVLTQMIFDLKVNSDVSIWSRLAKAIRDGNLSNIKEVSDLVEYFKELQTKRLIAMYVSKTTNPSIITKDDYLELHERVSKFMERAGFKFYTYIPYKDIHNLVLNMLEKA